MPLSLGQLPGYFAVQYREVRKASHVKPQYIHVMTMTRLHCRRCVHLNVI